MKQIALTDQEAKALEIYLVLTSGRITEELKIWNELKGEAPAAEKNIKFWENIETVVGKLKEMLQ